MRTDKKRIAVGMTGASGMLYGLRLLDVLAGLPEYEIHLTISPAAARVLQIEHDLKLKLERVRWEDLGIAKERQRSTLYYHHHENIAASLASGSFTAAGYVIAPCSMNCVAKIANGISDDLIERTADVMIKERRPVIILPRETPLSAIHLENLLKLARLGVTVMPAMPGFYGRPGSIDELVEFMVARMLDHLQIEHKLGPRWGEPKL